MEKCIGFRRYYEGDKAKKLILYISSVVVIGIISVIVMLSYSNLEKKFIIKCTTTI